MNKNREPEFTVTDRRRFTSEGASPAERPAEESAPELQSETPKQEAVAAAPISQPEPQVAPPEPVSFAAEPAGESEAAPEYEAPSLEERKAQEDAFQASTRQLDQQMESALGGRQMQDLQMSFERFVASIYMSALMQLGLMREQSGPPPQVDLMGARQTIDTLAILADKTKGNLTMQEENLLQNCLYELRMAYVEVTNAITRAPQPGTGGPGRRP
ncbi:MAG: DUF1844 domain-containing protein [Candidatus Korobacteraceae bacterium]